MDLVSALACNRSFRTLAPIIRPASWIEDDATQATAHSDFSLILHHSSQKPAKTIGLNLVRMSDRAIIWSDYFNPNQFGINVRVTELLDHISENVTAHLHLFIKSISRLTQDNRVYERYLAQALMEKADLASIRRARSVLKGIHHNDLGYSETSAGIGFTLYEWKLLGGSDPSLIDSAHYFATNQSTPFRIRRYHLLSMQMQRSINVILITLCPHWKRREKYSPIHRGLHWNMPTHLAILINEMTHGTRCSLH